MLFRMVPKHLSNYVPNFGCFRAVLFRMVPKHWLNNPESGLCFRAVLFRMVPKRYRYLTEKECVLELCCFEWFQNYIEWLQ